LGSDEKIVEPAAIKTHMPKLAQGELVICPGGRHEVFMERPEIQTPVWEKITEFLELHAPQT